MTSSTSNLTYADPMDYEDPDENAVVFGDDEIVKYDTSLPTQLAESTQPTASPSSLVLDSWWCPPPISSLSSSIPPSLHSVPLPPHFPVTSTSTALSPTMDLKRLYTVDFSTRHGLVAGGGHGGYVNVWSLEEVRRDEERGHYLK